MTKAQLNGENIQAFILGGKAVFTVANPETGNRYTYRVRASKDGRVHFVSLLTGSDNESDYSYIGFIRDGAFFHGGAKSRAGRNAPGVVAFGWVWRKRANPAPAEVWHEGRCCRCGRKLTVPESIATGMGPECSGRGSSPTSARERRAAAKARKALDREAREALGESTARVVDSILEGDRLDAIELEESERDRYKDALAASDEVICVEMDPAFEAERAESEMEAEAAILERLRTQEGYWREVREIIGVLDRAACAPYERALATFEAEGAEAMMAAIEAAGDRAETERDERAKFLAREAMESGPGSLPALRAKFRGAK